MLLLLRHLLEKSGSKFQCPILGSCNPGDNFIIWAYGCHMCLGRPQLFFQSKTKNKPCWILFYSTLQCRLCVLVLMQVFSSRTSPTPSFPPPQLLLLLQEQHRTFQNIILQSCSGVCVFFLPPSSRCSEPIQRTSSGAADRDPNCKRDGLHGQPYRKFPKARGSGNMET